MTPSEYASSVKAIAEGRQTRVLFAEKEEE